MNDSIDILKELSLLIRNATKSGENTAERVGRTFVGIVDILSEITLDRLREIFLRKDQSDYNPQIQISAESETKRSIFREKDKTKRSKKESAQHSKSRNKSFVMTSVSAL